jgi:hypothetical protein
MREAYLQTPSVILTVPEQRQVDAVAHAYVAEIARVQMVTGIIDRQHFFGTIRVGRAFVKVDHRVEGAGRARIGSPGIHHTPARCTPPRRTPPVIAPARPHTQVALHVKCGRCSSFLVLDAIPQHSLLLHLPIASLAPCVRENSLLFPA